MQRLQRVSKDYERGLEGFRDGLASRGDMEEALRVYHEKHVEPLVDFLNWRLAPWWERAWWAVQDRWSAWRSKGVPRETP